jgi:hypothetical protein
MLANEDGNRLDEFNRFEDYENWNRYSINSIIPDKKISRYRNTSDDFASESSLWSGNYPRLVKPFS